MRQDESEDVLRDRLAVDVVVGHPDVGAGHILAEVLDPGPERLHPPQMPGSQGALAKRAEAHDDLRVRRLL